MTDTTTPEQMADWICKTMTLRDDEWMSSETTDHLKNLIIHRVTADREATAARVRAEPSGAQWAKCSEQLPKKDSGPILVFWDDGDITLWSANKLIRGKDHITHWMPLPPAPEEG